MINLIILQYKIFRNRVLDLSILDEVKIALFIFVGLFFLGGIYFGAFRLLSYLNTVAIIGPALINKLIALVFITSFSMVVFSSVITSFNTMFFSRDLHWLMATPLPISKIFAFKSANTFIFSTWMVFLALLPFILALGRVKGGGAAYYIWIFVLLVPFFGIACLLGITGSLLLVKFFPSRKTRDVLLFLSVIFITAIYMLLRFIQPEKLVKPDALEVVSQYLAYLNAPTAVYMPSWWITAAIFGIISGARGEFIFYAVLLIAVCAVLYVLVTALAKKIYFAGWSDSKVFGARGKKPNMVFTTRSPFAAFLNKDIKILFRDANQWSQLLVLGALIIVYVFSISKLPLDTMYLQNLVSFFSVALVGFIMSAVALRFSFPLISLEGGSLWLIKSAPLGITKLFWEKLIFGGTPIVLLGTLLTVLSGLLMKADTEILLILLGGSIIMSVGLSFLSVSFGALFPRFGMTNIAAIESSSGGILYMITSMFYIGLNVAALALPVQAFYKQKFGGPPLTGGLIALSFLAILIINAVFITIPAVAGLKKLKNLEA